MSYKIDTKRLDEIIAKLNGNADKVCREAAFAIEAEAKQLAPADTTALRNSIYTVTQREDNYGEAAAKATAKNPGVKTTAHPKPTGHIRARVGPCVDYAYWVEVGHAARPSKKYLGPQRWIAGHPYLKPAAENVSKRYVEMWRKGLLKP